MIENELFKLFFSQLLGAAVLYIILKNWMPTNISRREVKKNHFPFCTSMTSCRKYDILLTINSWKNYLTFTFEYHKAFISYMEPKFSKLHHTLFINGIINKSILYSIFFSFLQELSAKYFHLHGNAENNYKGINGKH